ncbi:helix-turn-helix domain-containing protein [Paenibacillus sanguinis]|uniref:helix-turn-helix domain-containing protein n=1 Tax=Paenibacillus sanguinis TaxID=225906 RepID=UPI00036A2546|nr:helix-turn-helix domain-containing protein [Paenibacillus sanguinis]
MGSIGQRIKRRRKELGLTIEDVKAVTGISTGTISSLENDKYSPSVAVLVPLSSTLKVSIDWIVTGSEFHISENKIREGLAQEAGNRSISLADMELLAKFHQLTEKEQGKIEGMIEGMLMSREGVRQPDKQSHSKSTDGREEAATSESA